MFDCEKVISERARATSPSGIRKFFDLMADMKDVISLTIGQPDFVTPWAIRESGIDSLQKGKTYYTPNAGLPELRAEISGYLKRKYNVSYKPEETLVTVGGSEAIDLAVRAVVDYGDEVIIHSPSFVCYGPLVSLCGGIPVIVSTDEKNEFRVTAEQLREKITPRTKMIILSYPNNPTGAVMRREDLEAIADVVRDTGIVILTDEIYAELTYGGRHCSIASLPGMAERTIYVGGFSKAFAMTGWRLGYACAPLPILKQMLKIHQYTIMCASITSQFAGIDALRNGDEAVASMTAEYDRRRKFILSGLDELQIPCFTPRGAFYVYPNISRFGLKSDDLASKLLYDYGVAVVPGTAFGAGGEGFVRISYAYSVKHITEGLERIGKFAKDSGK